jgi:hypothetical protein
MSSIRDPIEGAAIHASPPATDHDTDVDDFDDEDDASSEV